MDTVVPDRLRLFREGVCAGVARTCAVRVAYALSLGRRFPHLLRRLLVTGSFGWRFCDHRLNSHCL